MCTLYVTLTALFKNLCHTLLPRVESIAQDIKLGCGNYASPEAVLVES